jgi:hypothetical protein
MTTTDFITTLGTALLKNKRREWLDMRQLAQFCKAQGIFNNEGKFDEEAIKGAFEPKSEVLGLGCVLDGWERRVGWDLVFMLRASPSFVQSSQLVPELNNGEQN